jgi:CRP-like cAMP-binding protein
MDLEAFSKNYLVRGLTPEQIAEMAKTATMRRYVAQEYLMRTGEAGADVFVILKGRVNVLTQDGDKLAEVGPGTVLGEIALIDARPRSACANCIGMVDVAIFEAKTLRSWMNQNRELGFTVLVNLAQVLCGRLRDADSKIDALTQQTTDSWTNAL